MLVRDAGRGCDICKPTIASILASLGNGHILDGEQATLQDTNDHVMANMQKDGTYSVVPRIPGRDHAGRPARHRAGRQDFGLYTKITGGQRIDLFGARIEQLRTSGAGSSSTGSSRGTRTASPCAR